MTFSFSAQFVFSFFIHRTADTTLIGAFNKFPLSSSEERGLGGEVK
jgi:hypothetical protein